MRKPDEARDQMIVELRTACEGGASIRRLVANTGRSYSSVHAMLRESGDADAQPRRPESSVSQVVSATKRGPGNAGGPDV